MASTGPLIDGRSPRALFSDWVEEALAGTRPPPSGLAAAYLTDLLADRLRAGPGARAGRAREGEPTLAEAWLAARGSEGPRRAEGLRAVGDRALFVAGFFGESLTRKVVGVAYYRDIGQAAYGDLSAWLERSARAAGAGVDEAWGRLYAELAERFGDLLDVLATVGDRTRAGAVGEVLHLYERWLATGSEPVRRRLLALGCAVDALPAPRLQ
jgi:hypothetical protein